MVRCHDEQKPKGSNGLKLGLALLPASSYTLQPCASLPSRLAGRPESTPMGSDVARAPGWFVGGESVPSQCNFLWTQAC